MFTRYILPAVALFGVIFAVIFVHAGNKPVPASQPVADPAQAPFASYVAGAGIVESSTEEIPVGTLVPGVVSEIYKSIGERVRAGDPLFRIDSRDLEAELAVRKADLVSAKANVSAQEATAADMQNQWKNAQAMGDARAMSAEELDRRRFAAQVAAAKLEQANADVVSAEAHVKQTETELDRRIVRARVDGTLLQSKIHLGEYAQVGPLATPLMLLGNTDVLNVRVDIDENDAWRVDTTRAAIAFVRGNRDLSTELHFVRIEPYVVPKRSLTGDSSERVDTRVLQVVYSFNPKSLPVFVGQQMDVFIEARPIGQATAYTRAPASGPAGGR
ncbi:MAG TPA: efflux RND transporter periplasmic adaptor subunit [Tepidisphaeraceae bacterium]|nr:efflux RND transporter periplasmic adaptor subunit [Tepidisphaeraceae bacterium]